MKFIQKLQRRTPLGWLQLSHDRGRLVVAIAGIAFADVLMFMQLGFQNSLYDSNTRVDRAMRADVIISSPRALNQQLDKIKIPDVVLFDRGARGKYAETIAQVDKGQTIATEAENRTLTIGGLFRLGASFGADASLMSSDQTFLHLFPRRDAASVVSD